MTGTASALTYGQFAAMEYAGIKPLGRQSSPQTQRHQRTPVPELYQSDRTLRQLNSSCEYLMYCPDCRHRAKSFVQPVSTHSIRCEYASQVSQLTAIQDTARHFAWIGHPGLHRNPSAKRRSCLRKNLRRSAILQSRRRFYTGATGLEACDWPSQNEAVQLNTEKAVSTR